MEPDAIHRAFDHLHDFELVQSHAVSELGDDLRTEALADAIRNLRAFVGISDEATGAFHRRFDAFLEEFSGEKPPDELSVWGFVGFMLCLVALEEEPIGRRPEP